MVSKLTTPLTPISRVAPPILYRVTGGHACSGKYEMGKSKQKDFLVIRGKKRTWQANCFIFFFFLSGNPSVRWFKSCSKYFSYWQKTKVNIFFFEHVDSFFFRGGSRSISRKRGRSATFKKPRLTVEAAYVRLSHVWGMLSGPMHPTIHSWSGGRRPHPPHPIFAFASPPPPPSLSAGHDSPQAQTKERQTEMPTRPTNKITWLHLTKKYFLNGLSLKTFAIRTLCLGIQQQQAFSPLFLLLFAKCQILFCFTLHPLSYSS